MRVVIIGSLARSLLNFRGPLLATLRARGHDVIAFAGAATDEDRTGLAALGVAFEDLEIARAGLDPRADLRLLAHLARRLRQLRPDVVLSYTIKPVIYGSLAARLARVPLRAAMITGLGYAMVEPRSTKQRLVRGLVRRMYRGALAGCAVVLFQNPDDRRELTSLGLVPAGARVEVVRGSGVDLARFAPTPAPSGPTTFLFLGRLLYDKGIAEFVAAATALRARRDDVRFVVVGWFDPNPESASRADMEAWVASGAVEYLGAMDDVRPALASAHVLVLPSYREGTPRSVLEAMAMRRAVVTTDAPGCRETVVDGESGRLVPPRDAAALTAALEELAGDRALLERLAEAGHQRARALYDANLVGAQVADLLGL